MKKNTLVSTLLVLAGLIILYFVYARFTNSKIAFVETRSAFNRPDVEKELEDHARAITRIEKESFHLRAAERFEEKGEYDQAISECYEALKYTGSKQGANQWVARRALGRIFEKARKYDLALKELDWAESVQNRPDVLTELAKDRSRLENLIKK